jgi:glutamine synthetase
MGHDPLPASLHDAIGKMEESELLPEILGEQVYEHFLRNKREEWQDYRLQVTPYELVRNLGIL